MVNLEPPWGNSMTSCFLYMMRHSSCVKLQHSPAQRDVAAMSRTPNSTPQRGVAATSRTPHSPPQRGVAAMSRTPSSPPQCGVVAMSRTAHSPTQHGMAAMSRTTALPSQAELGGGGAGIWIRKNCGRFSLFWKNPLLGLSHSF